MSILIDILCIDYGIMKYPIVWRCTEIGLRPIYDANDRRYPRMQIYERISLILSYPSVQQSQDCSSHTDRVLTRRSYAITSAITNVLSLRTIEGNNFVAPCVLGTPELFLKCTIRIKLIKKEF